MKKENEEETETDEYTDEEWPTDEEIEKVIHYNDDLIPASWKKTHSETSNNYPMES